MHSGNNKILAKMLERLLNALLNGPSLNCRPHASRQRIDWTQLDRLQDGNAATELVRLLTAGRKICLKARVPAPAPADRAPLPPSTVPESDASEPVESAAVKAWREQQAVLSKLRTIVEDSKTYEQDTGVHVLNIGYPLLSLPPGAAGSRQRRTARIVAPLAFIPVQVTLKTGVAPSVDIACMGDGVDLVVPNFALMAWLEQQTGRRAAGLFADETGDNPWREIGELIGFVAGELGLAVPEGLVPRSEVAGAASIQLVAAPKREQDTAGAGIVPAAVLGLFPAANQGLLRDTQAMVAGEEVSGPIESFISVEATLDATVPHDDHHEQQPRLKRQFADERLIVRCDPCQLRAVKLARTCRGLVVHGPPGTGKSQTITGIIGDHLARGQRVLVVCDKRTALDVVTSRLGAVGLEELCAVVHDPQRDQRDLYRSIRAQLEALPEAGGDQRASVQIDKIDRELQRLHDELAGFHSALSSPADSLGLSFHDCVGEWFSIDVGESPPPDGEAFAALRLAPLDAHAREVREMLDRGRAADHARNRWVQAAGIGLAEFLARPMAQMQEQLSACVHAARHADSARDESMPAFAPDAPLAEQTAARVAIAEKLEAVMAAAPAECRAHWASRAVASVKAAARQLAGARPAIDMFNRGPLDAELALALRDHVPTMAGINADLSALEEFKGIAGKWYAFLKPGIKRRATAVIAPLGLPLSAASADRAIRFLTGLRARLVLSELHATVLAPGPGGRLIDDEALTSSIKAHSMLFDLLLFVHAREAALAPAVATVLTDADAAQKLARALRKCPHRIESMDRLMSAAAATSLFNTAWLKRMRVNLCEGASCGDAFAQLGSQFETLENVLRVREGLAGLPEAVAPGIRQLLSLGIDADRGCRLLRKAALANEAAERLRADKRLQMMDGQRIQTVFDRYLHLEADKPKAIRNDILHAWRTRQRERLLAGTGLRMNSLGAEVRRRLLLKGRNALRLRQAIALGERIEGGDPLFDLRPVWMASPETVAQLFPRTAMFDVVIFDEASQCRLEEALPVLTRARRVVVSGDPKQLPPTRFFESALAATEDEEIETEQDLFEAQQSDVEDLLTAALNLDIQECYLDVHYRSRNADLIEFSNEHFYESRLQPIPGHPNNRTRFAPVTLYQVDGVYEQRANLREADEVCRIVRDLLRRAEPPSIGVACFNLTQRDLINERLDALAEQDRDFGRRLEEARTRVQDGAPAHLFVKNLENVQGDERDHMIISTTYGPDARGRFYQRFGPVGRAGGGRRLNVLVTRARDELHLVTSIPPAYYRNLPVVPAGQSPGGGWLLYAYLRYAEMLKSAYDAIQAEPGDAVRTGEPRVQVSPTKLRSALAESLAAHLVRQHRSGSTVYWGNSGFCVDLAMHHPNRADDVTIGVLCDGARYDAADDSVEWDVFRTSILESQGWRLHRVWSPQFFRDPRGNVAAILRDMATYLASEQDRDALPVAK